MTTSPAPQPTVVVLSLHTSPLEDPGTGDAGGMNTYVRQLSRAQAALGARVRVYTRSETGERWEVDDRDVTVVGLPVGPPGATKEDLPGTTGDFGDAVLADLVAAGLTADVVHSHYWLSGLAAERLTCEACAGLPVGRLPLHAHTMHTLGATKNAELTGVGDWLPEPAGRLEAETQLLRTVDLAVASTPEEAEELLEQGAARERVTVIPPGVDTDTFRPLEPTRREAVREEVRGSLGLGPDALLVVQAGRWQEVKGQDVLVAAAEALAARAAAPVHVLFVGGPSGASGSDWLPARIVTSPARDRLHTRGAVPPAELAEILAAADVVAVPSRTESFGLVAAEALAVGAPVVAAHVGGLPRALDGAGLLVEGHEPAPWADALRAVLGDAALRDELAVRAARRGERLSWRDAAAAHLTAYGELAGGRDDA
ncbi:D-inositol-3-phosphate glycosyltransferase [Kytococcus aerolatus]|uniref:D-inositol 3-phosphate glycosyltransferase n=1 Tax=Kytococcus aerolatus TaxID=592308 RepID=A0A212U6C6_9MICO|nr:glycosyltransferase [Kytococcus aerolatus]SNC73641.1 D-inositol-3-phosphate glycosyltransferase [Kytococcus aerolatus]